MFSKFPKVLSVWEFRLVFLMLIMFIADVEDKKRDVFLFFSAVSAALR